MFIISNALKNLARNLKRNILQGIVVFILLVGICLTIIIGDAIKVIVDNYEDQFEITANLELDLMSLLLSGNYSNYKDLTLDDYKKIAEFDSVKKVYLSYRIGAYLPDIEPVGDYSQKTSLNGIEEKNVVIGGDESDLTSGHMSNTIILGYNDITLLTDFIDGTRKLIEGEYFDEDNECIIGSELAEKNGIKVGDELTVYKAEGNYKLKVVGIFLDAKQVDPILGAEDPTANCRNEIITSYSTVESKVKDTAGAVIAAFVINSSEEVADFEEELKKNGYLDSNKLTTNKSEYDKIVKPVRNVEEIMSTSQMVLIICGIIVLSIISIISIHERKYEIGVLRSRGMRKWKVGAQFILENIYLVGICLVFGLMVSNVLAEPVSSTILSNQNSVLSEIESTSSSFPGTVMEITLDETTSYGDKSNIIPIDQVSANLNGLVLLKIILISLGLALLSSSATIVAVLRYEPSQILANRN